MLKYLLPPKPDLYKSLSLKFGDTKSRLLTFVFSALMHGYDFRVFSVLITLAFLTWIEMRLRKKLSVRLDACVTAWHCTYETGTGKSWPGELLASITRSNRQTEKRCCQKHSRTPYNSLSVNAINFAFSLLCIAHLAFLGSAFDGNERHATFEHVYEIWSFLNFYSLLLLVPTFVLYLLI